MALFQGLLVKMTCVYAKQGAPRASSLHGSIFLKPEHFLVYLKTYLSLQWNSLLFLSINWCNTYNALLETVALRSDDDPTQGKMNFILTWVNMTLQVSGIGFYVTKSLYCTVCPPPKDIKLNTKQTNKQMGKQTNTKMGKGSEQISLPRRHTNSQHPFERIFNLTSN